MKEDNKKKIVKYLRKEYSREFEKYEKVNHKISVQHQFKELDQLKIRLYRKVEQDSLENMFQLSLLIEWVERL